MKVMCPTYNRKSPKIFELMAKYPTSDIYFCVRKEEFEKGFYDDWKANEHCKFVLLEGCTNVGNTRKKVLEYCFEHNEKYIAMLDDNIQDIITEFSGTLSEIFDKVVEHEKSDPYFEHFGSIRLVKRSRKRKSNVRNYSVNATQCFILFVDNLKKKNINFVDSVEGGHEDCVLTCDMCMNGLCSVNTNVCKYKSRSCLPAHITPGGTHDNQTFEEALKMMNDKCVLSSEYLKTKYKDQCKGYCLRTTLHRGHELYAFCIYFSIKDIMSHVTENEQGNRKEN